MLKFQHQQVLAKIRESLAILGTSVDDFTDDEIELAEVTLAEIAQAFGISTQVLVDVVDRTAKANPQSVEEMRKLGIDSV